jgi:CheY-like chemotaxis protein
MSAIGKAAARVLVVEDEALVRLSAREEIEAAGFKVYEANNADEAIRLLEANSDIELVFTDVDMPGSRRREAGSLRANQVASGQNYRHLRVSTPDR